MRDQRVRDPIHNLISFSSKSNEDKLLWRLLQTPEMQRLRRIKQLGFSEFVYPGATHSRLSHSLGAMHMARRMLGVLERNFVFEQGDNHKLMRKATLAAALLHDVGHGPYSHVFEEVRSEMGLEDSHEDYTLEILESEHLGTILKEEGIFEPVTRFFKQEPGNDPYGAIVSSQMDCDRLDFLSRDRYHTGLRSAALDLEWLFDSLRIEEVPIDPLNGVKAFSFVVIPKGLSVVEEFVLSYVRMYQNVYFHKTTRGVQHMVRDIIFAAAKEADTLLKKNSYQPVLTYLTDKSSQTLAKYLRLDDASIVSLIHFLAEHGESDSKDLSLRYLRRDLYKCFNLPTQSTGELKVNLAAKFVEKLKNEGIPYLEDVPPTKSYKQYDVMDPNFVKNILIKHDGEHIPLGSRSEVARNLPQKQVRLYFPTEESRQAAAKLMKACRAS